MVSRFYRTLLIKILAVSLVDPRVFTATIVYHMGIPWFRPRRSRARPISKWGCLLLADNKRPASDILSNSRSAVTPGIRLEWTKSMTFAKPPKNVAC